MTVRGTNTKVPTSFKLPLVKDRKTTFCNAAHIGTTFRFCPNFGFNGKELSLTENKIGKLHVT
jgi:hypothetical protein